MTQFNIKHSGCIFDNSMNFRDQKPYLFDESLYSPSSVIVNLEIKVGNKSWKHQFQLGKTTFNFETLLFT